MPSLFGSKKNFNPFSEDDSVEKTKATVAPVRNSFTDNALGKTITWVDVLEGEAAKTKTMLRNNFLKKLLQKTVIVFTAFVLAGGLTTAVVAITNSAIYSKNEGIKESYNTSVTATVTKGTATDQSGQYMTLTWEYTYKDTIYQFNDPTTYPSSGNVHIEGAPAIVWINPNNPKEYWFDASSFTQHK